MSRKYSSSKGNHNFAMVPDANIKRSVFDRSHGLKTTFDASRLIPVYVDEALPGDTFKMSMTAFARIATPIKPVMDNIILESFFFAVPNRLLWDNWERFCGYQTSPGDSTDFTIPVVEGDDSNPLITTGSLADYFGLPYDLTYTNTGISALPFRAYRLIWNEWFRDQNLVDPRPVPTNDGPDIIDTSFVPERRGKRKDYFTGALPFPQKGPAVDIPIGTTAPIVSTGAFPLFTNDAGASETVFSSGTGGFNFTVVHSSPNEGAGFAFGTETGLQVDLTTQAATINSLREAFQTQRLLERDARGGTRYTEIIRAHFNVVSPDSRLQRPEYLGGGRSYVNFQSVPQTAPTDAASTAQANLAAYGTIAAMNHGFSQSFTEHMTIIGMICVRADLTYQQGINRMWLRSTRFDFFWPALAHLGEQEILSKEIYADGSPNDDNIFGYQERYAEYRYKPSMITGLFRSTVPQPLDIWHLAQEFATRPVLNKAFIEEDVPMTRVKAVTSEPDFIGDFQFNLRCARPMPVYGVPGYIDHF